MVKVKTVGKVKSDREVYVDMRTAVFTVRGVTAYGQNRLLQRIPPATSVGVKGKIRKGKDFDKCFRDAQHISTEGWNGIPVSAFRLTVMLACRLLAIQSGDVSAFDTPRIKMAMFIHYDGVSPDGVQLVRITKGEPQHMEHVVRNASGVIDIRARPVWDPGWEAIVRVKYDASVIGATDIANLLARAGAQCGIGEGRNASPESCGKGWGGFEVAGYTDAPYKSAAPAAKGAA